MTKGNRRELMFIMRRSFITGVLVTLALTILRYDVNAGPRKISRYLISFRVAPSPKGTSVIASAASLPRRLKSGATGR